MQQIEGQIRKAIEDYNMIENGDKIAIALSGGKDSTSLLYSLKNMQRYLNIKYDIIAICINPGFDGFDEKIIRDMCDEANVELHLINSHIKQIVFDERKEQNPCSLCANLRRGILNSTAKEFGCNKIALGHNEDDVLETFLMNIIYAGRIATFSPVSYMDRSKITLIRPLIYLTEKQTKGFVKQRNITIMPKVCPKDGNSSREFAYKLLKQLEIKNKQTRANMIGAIKRAKIDGWKE